MAYPYSRSEFEKHVLLAIEARGYSFGDAVAISFQYRDTIVRAYEKQQLVKVTADVVCQMWERSE